MHEADIDISRQSLAHSAREIRTGQILGFLIGAICIVSGSVTAIMGHPVSGTFFGASGVCGLVTAFIYGRKGADKDRQAAPGDKKTRPCLRVTKHKPHLNFRFQPRDSFPGVSSD